MKWKQMDTGKLRIYKPENCRASYRWSATAIAVLLSPATLCITTKIKAEVTVMSCFFFSLGGLVELREGLRTAQKENK